MVASIINRFKKIFKKENTPKYVYVTGKGKDYFLLKNARKPLKLTRMEALMILEMRDDGYGVEVMFNEIDFKHNISRSTIRTFLRNYDKGMFKEELD